MEVGALSWDGAGAAMALRPAAGHSGLHVSQAAFDAQASLDRYVPGAPAADADYGPRLKAQAVQRAASDRNDSAAQAAVTAVSDEDGRADPQAAVLKARVESLQSQDERVRRHEQAHLAAGAHGVSYRLVMGPDGRAYAVGGQAVVPTTNLSFTPEEAMVKAQQAKRVALAPVDPSSQDLRVAVDADRVIRQAQLEIQARYAMAPALMTRSDGSLLSLLGALRTFAHVRDDALDARPAGG